MRAIGCGCPRTLSGLPAIAAAAIASAAMAATTAESAGAAVGLGASFVDVEGAAIEVLAVEGVDGVVGFRVVRHFDECESARLTRIAIPDDVDIVHAAVRLERRTKSVFGGPEAEITDKDIFH